MSAKLNRQGGIVPSNNAERQRARRTDLGTLPKSISGATCASCEYMEVLEDGTHWCINTNVDQVVSKRMVCSLWDAKGFLRP